MITFFVRKDAGKSSCANKCMQLIVTDKGFVYVVPVKSKYKVPNALKMFAMEIGTLDALICGAAHDESSNAVKSFCHQIGAALHVLEKNTPWANRTELYVGLVKESVRKT